MTGFEQLLRGQLPKLVMFDLDGTLIDSVPDLAVAVETMLLKLGRPPAGIESVRMWIGNGAPMLVRRALAGNLEASGVDDAQAEQALEIFMDAYDGNLNTRVGTRCTLSAYALFDCHLFSCIKYFIWNRHVDLFNYS